MNASEIFRYPDKFDLSHLVAKRGRAYAEKKGYLAGVCLVHSRHCYCFLHELPRHNTECVNVPRWPCQRPDVAWIRMLFLFYDGLAYQQTPWRTSQGSTSPSLCTHLPCAAVHSSAKPPPALVFIPCPAPWEDASVGQMGFLCAQTPLSHLPGCHALQFSGRLPHLQLGTVPSSPEGEFEYSVCFCTFIKI